MFGARAESLSRYLSKGTKVAIEGKLRYSSWEGKDGQRRSKIEVVVDDLEFLSSRNQQGGRPVPGLRPYQGGNKQQYSTAGPATFNASAPQPAGYSIPPAPQVHASARAAAVLQPSRSDPAVGRRLRRGHSVLSVMEEAAPLPPKKGIDMAQQKQDFQRQPRRKYCQFCKEGVEYIDYKDVQLLRKYMTDRGKIKPRRVTGTCTQHQHDIANAIKRAREMALLPYTVPVVSSRGGRSRG